MVINHAKLLGAPALAVAGQHDGSVHGLALAAAGRAGTFARGLAPRLLYKVPASAVFLLVYELLGRVPGGGGARGGGGAAL